MEILVTGGKGFVGRRLVKELRRQGHNVKTYDITDRQDICDFQQVKMAVKGVDVIYHLAACLDETDPERMRNVNVKGTENMLEAAAKQNVKQFIYMSTCGVMGNITKKVNEGQKIQPHTKYEQTKARAEKAVWNYQEMLPVTIVRSALVLGANEYWKMIIKLVKRHFPLVGKGDQKWQIIYIDDLVNVLAFVLENDDATGEIFIVAGKEESTLKDVYFEIRNILGKKKKLKSIPVWFGRLVSYIFLLKKKISGGKTVVIPQHIDRLQRVRWYDTGKIEALGWKPKYSLKEGMQKTYEELVKKGMF